MEYYYHNDIQSDTINLSQEESRHVIAVLHHKAGDHLRLFDGKGCLAKAIITVPNKQACILQIIDRKYFESERAFKLHIAIAPTKNKERIEWFTEKAVEIGVERISFIQCEHSERVKLDLSRIERLAIAAAKQSQTPFLPEIQIIKFLDLLEQYENKNIGKFLAWCDSESQELATVPLKHNEIIVAIGPEGDFSDKEVTSALQNHWQDVRLGNKRLRTETAGLYALIVLVSRMGLIK
jgi:16S rRNA (uracil1498-N3)-methyltransferase